VARIFYDTEFLDDGQAIDLISIGLVADDGREYYAVQQRTWRQWRKIYRNEWLRENVIPSLPRIRGDRRLQVSCRTNPLALDFYAREMKARRQIRDEVRDFILASGPGVELWADYAAYDHVALCQLFGRMIDLPDGVPMWTHDFQQAWEMAGRPEMPEQMIGVHNALADARHLKVKHHYLAYARIPDQP
jgi:hypothetical protein